MKKGDTHTTSHRAYTLPRGHIWRAEKISGTKSSLSYRAWTWCEPYPITHSKTPYTKDRVTWRAATISSMKTSSFHGSDSAKRARYSRKVSSLPPACSPAPVCVLIIVSRPRSQPETSAYLHSVCLRHLSVPRLHHQGMWSQDPVGTRHNVGETLCHEHHVRETLCS